MIYCIDSQIFIWGIKKQCTEGQENMIERALHFFKKADEDGHHILIPTVVIAEILAPEPKETYPEYMKVITENFMIGEFNTLCAVRYANLLHNKFNDLKQFAHDNGIRREKMKTDFMVVATALAYNANVIFSNDKEVISYSKGLIPANNLPKISDQQLDLFAER